MKILKVEFRNFGSYGNRTVKLEIPNEPGFWLIQGKNGHGKCVMPDTKIKISVNKTELEKINTFLKIYRSKRD